MPNFTIRYLLNYCFRKVNCYYRDVTRDVIIIRNVWFCRDLIVYACMMHALFHTPSVSKYTDLSVFLLNSDLKY